MCGIYGMIFHSNRHTQQLQKIRTIFSGMAEAAVTRGDDAAGAAVIQPDFNVIVYKNALPSPKVVRFRRWGRLLRQVDATTLALMGHTRLGTHGNNTIGNAHPFAFEAVVGTHNGVVGNHARFGPATPFECDSANVIYRFGLLPRQDWTDFLETLQGSFALAIATSNEFHLMRNNSSPCELAYIPELDATIYASTIHIIVAGLTDVEGIAHPVFQELPSGEIWSYVPGNKEPNSVEKFQVTYPSVYGLSMGNPRSYTPGTEYARHGTVAKDCEVMGAGKCEYCDEYAQILVDHESGMVCGECYNELMEPDVDYKDSAICDLCDREFELHRYGTSESFLCRFCAAEMNRDTPPREVQLAKVYCEGCSEEFNAADVGQLFREHEDFIVCKACWSRWGPPDDAVMHEVLSVSAEYVSPD